MRFRESKKIIAIEEARKYAIHIIETKDTIRQTASYFDTNSARVSRYINSILEKSDSDLFVQVKEILEKNKINGRIKGGESTRAKFKK